MRAHLIAYIVIVLALEICTFGQVHQLTANSTSPGQLRDADPFDVATGIYSREYTDFSVNDSIPIEFVRTYRNLDSTSRSFGVGTSTSYDMFIIGDTSRFSWVALVLADGSRVEYTRISSGIGFSDGVFEAKTTPDKFLNSRISWNGHGGWSVKLSNGLEYTVHGCNGNSKPGQCAVTEIKNGLGDRLVVERDPDGNINRIVSPHRHVLTLTTDGAGRITRAETDPRHWIRYSYDNGGRLVSAVSSRGARQRFKYDPAGNMLSVHENGYSIINHYDKNNRFSWQKISDGQIFSANYKIDRRGKIVQTDVNSSEGLLRYYFDQSARVAKEEFRPGRPHSWQLEYARDPQTNVLQSVLLTCGTTRKTFLPTDFATVVSNLGEGHKQYVTQMCWPATPRRPKRNDALEPVGFTMR